MSSFWILQANPDHFDIAAALDSLSEMAWRTPQYAASIAPGDVVVIWRSGAEAGVVGVGRVLGYPAECAVSEAEQRFTLGGGEGERTTRVPISVRPSTFVPKSLVANLNGWSEHQIVTGPMGTVFQLSEAQWSMLAPQLPPPPEPPTASDVIPPTLGWDQRRKDVYPLPGGYGGYLDTLARLCGEVASSKPTRSALTAWVQEQLGITETSARMSLGFLVRIGLFHERSGTVEPSAIAATWLDTRDPRLLIGLLHSRVRFVGEFLHEALEPLSDSDVLAIANEYYGAGWKTRAQIRRRRGWLESAGFLTETNEGLLQTTPSGVAFLEQIELHARGATSVEQQTESTHVSDSPLPPPAVSPASVLFERLRTTGNAGSDADAFERETAEAFDRLGFRSTWLGKAGRTDVLLEADLGRHDAYRVIVDCKSTSRGAVSAQIDWDTIDEHRNQHMADYAIIVAPGFGGGKLGDRASRHDTVLLTIDDLGELLVQHERVPLTLETYRLLFTSDTVEDGLAAIGEVALAAERRLELVDAVLELLEAHGPRMAPMSARDFDLLLLTRDDLPDATEVEIDEVLRALSTPMLGLLDRNEDGAVRFVARPETTAATLRVLADRIAQPTPLEPTDTT